MRRKPYFSVFLCCLILLILQYIRHFLVHVGHGSNQNSHMLFFIRVPKCGSEMLAVLINGLSRQNSFIHTRLPDNSRQLTEIQQISLVEMVTIKALNKSRDAIGRHFHAFDRHVYFINFEKFGYKQPVFISIVRDPIDKLVSRFYYHRLLPHLRKKLDANFTDFEDCYHANHPECTFVPGKPYDLTIPYFCGHDDFCNILGDSQALQLAKKSAEHIFMVVGTLERLSDTFSALEQRIPTFFRGIKELYMSKKQPHTNVNPRRPPSILPEKIIKELRRNLSMEIEFYEFVNSLLPVA